MSVPIATDITLNDAKDILHKLAEKNRHQLHRCSGKPHQLLRIILDMDFSIRTETENDTKIIKDCVFMTRLINLKLVEEPRLLVFETNTRKFFLLDVVNVLMQHYAKKDEERRKQEEQRNQRQSTNRGLQTLLKQLKT